MNQFNVFDLELPLPNDRLSANESNLLGFEFRYLTIRDQLNLMLHADQLKSWNSAHHGGKLTLCELVGEQYPLIVFHGDVGTGKTATAECIANRLVKESGTEDSVLFKLSNRVRGSGRVGEMGSLLSDAFHQVKKSAGRERRAILIIDEGDSLAASRNQEHSHHEDKVAVNTLIQGIDDLRQSGGRIVVFLCTNRLTALDAAIVRRASIIEEFKRPSAEERLELLKMDLGGLELKTEHYTELVKLTGARDGYPTWTYSDIRTRLYPSAIAKAFPKRALQFEDLCVAASEIAPSPIMEDK